MFDEFLNQRVKVVYKDGDSIKVIRGVFLGMESNMCPNCGKSQVSKFLKINLEMSGLQVFNIETLQKMRLESEEEDENGYKARND